MSSTSFRITPRSCKAEIDALEFSMELSSEVPGTNANWPSDVCVWVNHVLVGTWTSPGDFGDKRGVYTPRWWKLEGSQYGHLKTWKITERGTFLDGEKASDVTLDQLHLADHHSIRLRIGIDEHAEHPGGMNIFGKGFGNYDQDIHAAPAHSPGRTQRPLPKAHREPIGTGPPLALLRHQLLMG